MRDREPSSFVFFVSEKGYLESLVGHNFTEQLLMKIMTSLSTVDTLADFL